MAEDGQYEQNEFLDVIFENWGKNRNIRESDHVVTDRIGNFDEILRNLMENEKLAPSTRIKAALYLREANGMEVLPVLRGIVTNLLSEKPSSELIRSLQRISVFVPEAENALNDIEIRK